MTVAILGCGAIGRVHAAAVRSARPEARIVVADPDLGAARATARAVGGVAAYADVAECLRRERPAVVHVCTPPTTHATLAADALATGAHVLVEKPLALANAELALVARELRTRPGALGVDHNYLFEPEMLRARRWIGEGRIGHVVAVEVVQGVDVRGAKGWRQALPGGRAMDLLPHGVYLARHFLGEVRGVAARGAGRDGGALEIGVLLECERGLGTLRVSLASAPWELSCTVRGTAGRVRIDFARQRAVPVRAAAGGRLARVGCAGESAWWTAAGAVGRLVGKASGRLRGYPGLRTLVARFHAAVEAGTPPPVGFEDGAAVATVLEKARHRLEEPRPELAVARRRIA